MDGPIFDAMLKNALQEALEEDLRQMEDPPQLHLSLRHRRRMRRMLADPWRYVRRLRDEEPRRQTARRRTLSRRWVLAAVIAALLAGTAAGYAIRSGEFLQSVFDKSPWAEEYAGAADTEQLLDMGGELLSTVVEDEHFRFELLDAVSEGGNAMAAVRLTVLDTQMLEETFGAVTVAPGYFLDQSGTFFETGSSSTSYRYPEDDPTLADNQMLMIFTSSGNAAGEDRYCTITFRDFGYCEEASAGEEAEVVLVPGEWTLEMELSFDSGLVLAGSWPLDIGDAQAVIEEIQVSALSLSMRIRCDWAEFDAMGELLRNTEICMEDGCRVPYAGLSIGGGGDGQIDVRYSFGMPLDRERVTGLDISGQMISLAA